MENLTKEATEAVAAAGTNRLKEMFLRWKDETFSFKSMRSWSVFCDRSKVSLPKVGDIFVRVKSNLVHFQTNYVIIFVLLVVYSILSNPWILLAVALCGGLWMYTFHWRTQPFLIGSHEVTNKEKTIALSAITLLMFWYASVSSTIFWLLGFTITVVTLHSLFYTPVEESDFDFNTSFGELKV